MEHDIIKAIIRESWSGLAAERHKEASVVNDYNIILNKPSINGVELFGDKISEQLNLVDKAAFNDIVNKVASLIAGGVWRGTFSSYAALIGAYPSLDVSATNWFGNDYVYVQVDERPSGGLHTKDARTVYIVQTSGDIKVLTYSEDVSKPAVISSTQFLPDWEHL